LSNFEQKDPLHGVCKTTLNAVPLGSEFVMDFTEEEQVLKVRKNQVITKSFEHPDGTIHDVNLLEGSVLPQPEIEHFEILHINRKFFGGEGAIKLVERILNIDCGIVSTYKFGYQNAHATWDKPRQRD